MKPGTVFGFAWGLLVIPALLMSSAIALRFWYDPALGDPVLGRWIYNPLDAVRWAREWGFSEPYKRDFLQGIGLAFVPSLFGMASLGLRAFARPLEPRPETETRAVHFGTAAELKKHGDFTASGDGVVIGKSGAEILRVQGDQHVLVTGPSGAGKTIGTIIPTALEHSGSLILFDPKHELTAITGRHRASLGPTFVFDPTQLHAHAFNPLLELRGGDHLHGDCQMIASLIARSETAQDPVWQEAACELITSLLLVTFERGQPTLAHLHDLVLDVAASRYPQSGNPFVRRVLAGHQALEDRVRSSVNFETKTSMAFMSDPIVRAATARSDFRAGDVFWGDRATTIYITIPPADHERLRALMRVVIQSITTAGLHSITHTVDGRQKTRDVLVLLDEFPSLRRMPFLEVSLAVCRGYKIRALLCCQDRTQIERSYGTHESITANCGTIAVMPGFSGSMATLEQWGGWALQTHRSRGRDVLKPLSVRMSETEERMPLLNPADLLQRKGEVLVLRLGCRPTWLERVRYFEEKRWHGRYDTV